MGRPTYGSPGAEDDTPPSTTNETTPPAGKPKLVLPPPAPQSEAEGLKNPDLPHFEFAANPTNDPTQRRDNDTRHPINKSWTRARDSGSSPPMKEKFE